MGNDDGQAEHEGKRMVSPRIMLYATFASFSFSFPVLAEPPFSNAKVLFKIGF